MRGMGGQGHTAAALPPGKTRYPLYRSWAGPRAGMDGCGKSRPLPPTGIRSPDRPARSESLYRLSYPFLNTTDGKISRTDIKIMHSHLQLQ